MVVTDVPHFLLFDSFILIKNTLFLHPVIGSLALLVLFGIVLAILHWKFERVDADVIIFTLIICAIVLLLGGSLVTFFHAKDFHIA